MPITDQPIGQDEESEQNFVDGIDPMESEIRALSDEIAVEVQCGIDHNHRFYLPYRLTHYVDTVRCPICARYFSHGEGDYDQFLVTAFQIKLTSLLRLLPMNIKDEIRDMVKNWMVTPIS